MPYLWRNYKEYSFLYSLILPYFIFRTVLIFLSIEYNYKWKQKRLIIQNGGIKGKIKGDKRWKKDREIQRLLLLFLNELQLNPDVLKDRRKEQLLRLLRLAK